MTTSDAVYDAVPLIPRDVLFGNPDRVGPELSPDGTRIGYVAPDEGVLNVWVGPRDGSSAPVPVTKDRDRGVRMFAFCHDDRHLVYLQDTGGDENWRLYAVDLVDGGVRALTPEGAGVQARLLRHNRWHPHEMMIALNDRNPQLHDVHRLDLRTGELTMVEENPGWIGWLVDSDLTVRGAIEYRPDGTQVIRLRDGAEGELAPFREIAHEDSAATGIASFGRDGRTVLMISSVGVNAAQLVQVDLDSGEETVLAADPTYDVSGVVLHPETLVPQAAAIDRDRVEHMVLDDAVRADFAKLAAFRDADLGVHRTERSDRFWLVEFSRADGPVEYAVYDRESGAIDVLFVHRDALTRYELAPMEPFTFTARDGLTVHGYATFPRGAERRGLPAVLDVHGGPWVRDTWGYRPEVQWLANRGYVVLQVNYRGSTGYGKAFVNAGDKQWGAAMQDDLTDAVGYAVEQGWVDADRVAIFGGSYGGYAALAGVTLTPEVYRCAVDLCGPSNLLTLLESVPEYWKPLITQFHQRMGDPSTERDMLVDRSPLTHAARIRVPVLVAQGANDPRVKQAEAEQIVQALRDNGVDHEYLLFDDEGHGFAKPASRERFYAACEPFLARHLGGRQQEQDAQA